MGSARPLMTLGPFSLLRTVLACVAAFGGFASIAHAQQAPLTLTDALARARQMAPQIVSARLAIDEARARLVGADLRFQTNPEIDFGLGRRSGVNDSTVDLDVSATQLFQPGARRTARQDSASAAIDRSTAQLELATREVLRDVAVAFYRVVHADRRIALLATAETLATTILQSADRRYRAGDIPVLDVNLARASHARVRSDRESAVADRVEAIGILRQLLQVGPEVRVDADITSVPPIDRATLTAAGLERPEVRQLEAAIREAEADFRFAQSFTRPEYGLGVSFRREEGDQTIGGLVKLALPVASKGQALRAESTARASRLRAELEATRARIQIQVDAAADAYARRRDAVLVLMNDALPGLDENDQLTARSFDAGQIGLPELLLIRRELLEIRFQYLDALLGAAIARVELDAVLGVLR